MEKKKSNLTFSDQPLPTKIVYTLVIVSLVVSAVVIGVVAAKNRNATKIDVPNNIVLEVPDEKKETETREPVEEKKETETLTFSAPCTGTLLTEHNLSVPVFSDTLGEWRVHSGIDIATEESAPVCVTATGVVSAIYDDALMGTTVEVKHENGVTSVYSNLDAALATGLAVGKTLKTGERIGSVGDTAIKELAEEPHLHFGMKIGNAAVNPLDYFSLTEKPQAENGSSLTA